MSRRSEILRAASEAAIVASRFPTGNRTSFDIVGAVTELNIPVIFRPLKGLWGAAITVDSDTCGILVTTRLGLHVQRFTLAHELGHVLLGHQFSLDETIGFAGRNSPVSRPIQEHAADTFASELLGAKRLMLESAKRHHWTREALRLPENIYQLSLRLGMSFQATCWALTIPNVLTVSEASELQSESVKLRKRAIAPEDLITNSWADVWALTQADTGTHLEAGPDDLFAVHVQDHASAGYLWQVVDTGSDAEVVGERLLNPDQAYGDHSSRVIFLRFQNPGVHRLSFEHIRPWSGAKLGHIDIDIDGFGKEVGGFARRTRVEALRCA